MSDNLNLVATGKVVELSDKIVVSDKFSKRELVLEHTKVHNEREFKNFFKIDFKNKMIEKLDGVSKGDIITVSANAEGNKWSKNDGSVSYFNVYSGWKVEKQKGYSAQNNQEAHAAAKAEPIPPQTMDDFPPAPDEDDLPF